MTEDELDIINGEISKIIGDDMSKQEYRDYVKHGKYGWYLANLYYEARVGTYPLNKKYNHKRRLKDVPIMDFLKSADIELYNDDGIKIFDRYSQDKNNFIFLDPPYLHSCNVFYDNLDTKSSNIYEHLLDTGFRNFNASVVLVHEYNWLFKYLFKDDCVNIKTYDKRYELTKKQTKHIIISNINK